MRKPKLTVENAVAVYDYYQKREINQFTSRLFCRIAGLIFRPQIAYAESVPEQLSEHFAAKGNLIVAANHVSTKDPGVIAAVASRSKPLRPMLGNVNVPAKVPLFNAFLRPVFDSVGGLPTFRRQDVLTKATQSKGEGSPNRAIHAASLLIDTCIAKLDAGNNLVIFPEGTLSPNPPELLPIKSGIGRIACGLQRPENTLILPLGIYYDQTQSSLRPDALIGEPFSIADTPQEVCNDVAQNLARTVNHAARM